MMLKINEDDEESISGSLAEFLHSSSLPFTDRFIPFQFQYLITLCWILLIIDCCSILFAEYNTTQRSQCKCITQPTHTKQFFIHLNLISESEKRKKYFFRFTTFCEILIAEFYHHSGEVGKQGRRRRDRKRRLSMAQYGERSERVSSMHSCRREREGCVHCVKP